MSAEPSEWQKKIAGEWHGRPGLFDAEGNHVGYERIARASEVLDDGSTVYWMNGTLDGAGPLRNRFQLGADFRFQVIDSDENRVYLGPDFHGTGQPYGLFVDAHYYSPGWQADLRTWNQVLPDGKTQVYSSVLHDGWAVCAVFNGLYKVIDVGDTAAETTRFVDDWIAEETARAPRPHVLPTKAKGRWTGTMEVYDTRSQEKIGDNLVTIDHNPHALTRATQTITWEGVVERKYTLERFRKDQNTTFESDDVMGNARNFGRALFTSQHFTGGDVWKIKGREYLMDDSQDLAVVWELFKGDLLTQVHFGLLELDGVVVTGRSIVVTGSTRGIGLGLAREFLARGCRVTVVGRSQESVDKALAELGGGDRTTGIPADVAKRADHQRVWDHAVATFGQVDIWINNAGISLPSKPLWATSEEDWHRIVDINYHGAVNGSAVAAAGMLEQGSGFIWNMEGFGSNGMNRTGTAPYGSTKYALRYFTTTLGKDLDGKPVKAGFLSPGIVVTDLLTGDYDQMPPQVWEKVKKTLTILADRVETVTPFLAEGVLAADKNGARVEWLTKGKAARRFATAPFSKRDPFAGGTS